MLFLYHILLNALQAFLKLLPQFRSAPIAENMRTLQFLFKFLLLNRVQSYAFYIRLILYTVQKPLSRLGKIRSEIHAPFL